MRRRKLARLGLADVSPGSHLSEPEWANATPEEVGNGLRQRLRLSDEIFDQFLSDEQRFVSAMHWTPLVVAIRVAQWLNEIGARTVVDLGSGVGKFCVATALAGDCRFTGIEQRRGLVDAARTLATTFNVGDRVQFIHGSVGETPVPRADVYYMFNPFGENIFDSKGHIDSDVELGRERYDRDVAYTEQFLQELAPDTYVIKYNGFGGYMPRSFEPVRIDRAMPEVLRMWHKPHRS